MVMNGRSLTTPNSPRFAEDLQKRKLVRSLVDNCIIEGTEADDHYFVRLIHLVKQTLKFRLPSVAFDALPWADLGGLGCTLQAPWHAERQY